MSFRSRCAFAILSSVAIASITGCGSVADGPTGAESPSVAPTTTPAAPTSTPAATASAAASPSADLAEILPGEAWIVYDGGSRVRFIRPDGTGDHALTASLSETGPQLHARWSGDGQHVAFAADAPDGTRDIWVASVDGAELRRVLDCADPCAWADDPSWSPDDAALLVQVGVADGDPASGLGLGQLWAVDIATGATRVLFTAGPREYLYLPRWSPDGAMIAVEVDLFDSPRLDASVIEATTIGLINLGVGDPVFEPLLDWETLAAAPDWSPDGSALAFHMAPDGVRGTEIHTIDVGDLTITRVTDATTTGGQALLPTWVRDSGELLFDLEPKRGDSPVLAFVQPDGSGIRTVPPESGFRGHPMARPLPSGS